MPSASTSPSASKASLIKSEPRRLITRGPSWVVSSGNHVLLETLFRSHPILRQLPTSVYVNIGLLLAALFEDMTLSSLLRCVAFPLL
jgi:hypothetical protein